MKTLVELKKVCEIKLLPVLPEAKSIIAENERKYSNKDVAYPEIVWSMTVWLWYV